MKNITGKATVGDDATVKERAIVAGHAEVNDEAIVGGHAVITGRATIRGEAVVNGRAQVSGEAMVSGYAIVTGSAIVSGNLGLSGNAHVSGTAVVSEQHHVAWGQFKARSGRYTLTLYMQDEGTVGFTWGCREGTDLRAYLNERPDYAASGLDVAVLAFLREFERGNGIVVEAV